MQQNMLILLVVIVIAVVIVAAVLMMSGGSQAPPVNPGNTAAPPASDVTPPVETPPVETPPAQGSDELASGLTLLSSGGPAVCTISVSDAAVAADPSLGVAGTFTMKVEGTNSRIEATSEGETTTIIGKPDIMYMTSTSMGNQWFMYSLDDFNTTETGTMSPEEIQTLAAQGIPTGVSFDCQAVADIPDSEFELPADAEVVDMEELINMYTGGDVGATNQ